MMSVEPKKAEALSQQCVDELKQTISVTDDSSKYQYTQTVNSEGRTTYVFPEVYGVVQAVAREKELVREGRPGERVGIVLDRTCFYCEAGGQQGDKGWIEGDGWRLDCDSVLFCGGYVLHSGLVRRTSE